LGQVSTPTLPPAPVSVLKRAGLGEAISGQTSSDAEKTAGSSVPSIRS
jgi:hypothetical protein